MVVVEALDEPTTELELGLSMVVVDSDNSGRSAIRSVTCHINPTDAGYPIVRPTAPRSCADAGGAPQSANVSAQNPKNRWFIMGIIAGSVRSRRRRGGS